MKRRLRRTALILLSVPFVAIAGILLALPTSPGRAALRWAIETAARSSLEGTLTIGAIEGSPYTTLRLAQLEMRAKDGRQAVALDRLQVSVGWTALVRGTVHVRQVSVDGLALDWPALQDVLPKSPAAEPQPSESEPMPVVIDRLSVRAPSIVIGPTEALTALDLVATATVDATGIAATLTRLKGQRNGLPFEARGAIRTAPSALPVLALRAKIGDLSVELRRATKPSHPIDIRGRVAWPAGTVAALLDAPMMRGAADLQVRATGSPDRLNARVDGMLGGASILVELKGFDDPIGLRILAQRLDPSKLHDAAPPARLNLSMSATVSAANARPRGTGRIRVSGTVRPRPSMPVITIDDATLETIAEDDRVRADVALNTSVGRARVEARVRPYATSPHVDSARVRIDALELGALAPGQLGGSVDATLSAKGPITAAAVEAEFWATHLAVGALRLGGMSGRLSAERDPMGLDLDWSGLRWAAPRSTWTATAGRARLAGKRVSVSELLLTSAKGAVRAVANIDLSAPLGSASTAQLDLTDIDLAAFRGLHPTVSARAEGHVQGRIRLDGPGRRVTAELDARNVEWSPTWPPTTARLRAEVGAAGARANLSARGQQWGSLSASARVDAPTSWRKPAAWTANGLAAVRTITADFDVQLAAALPKVLRRGQVRGAVSIAEGGRRARARVAATDIVAEGLPTLSAVNLSVTSANDVTDARLNVDVEAKRALTAGGRIPSSLPELLADPTNNLRADVDATIDRFPLDVLQLQLPSEAGRPAQITGAVSVNAKGRYDRSGPRLDADVRLNEVRLAPTVPPLEGRLAARIAQRVATASVALSAPELGHHALAIEARIPVQLDPITLAKNIETLSFHSRGVELTAVGAIVGADGLSGTLEASGQATSALRTIVITVAGDAVRANPALVPIDVDARFAQTSTGSAVVLRAQAGPSQLARSHLSTPATVVEVMSAKMPVNGWPLTGWLETQSLPIRHLIADETRRRAVQGRLSLRADISGTSVAPGVAASATARGLRLGSTRFEAFDVTHRQNATAQSTRATLVQASGGRLNVDVAATDARSTATTVSAQAFDLAFLSTLAELSDAGAAVDGRLDGTLIAKGTGADALALQGSLVADRIRFAVPGAPPIDDGVASLEFAGRAGEVIFEARSGAGSITANLSASADPRASRALHGRFQLDDVQAAGGGRIVSIDLNGEISGRRSPKGVDVQVGLTDGLVRLPEQTARNLHPITAHGDVVYQRSRWAAVGARTASPPPASVVTVRVRTKKPIGVRGEPIDAVFNVDVEAHPSARGTSIRGDARIEQGTVTLFGRRYTVERAQVVLGGQVPPRPRVDVLLSYEFDACTFYVGTRGPVDNPKLTLTSKPDIYDDRQLLGFLFGASPDEDNPDKTPQEQGVDAAADFLIGQLQAQLKNNLPIDSLAVDLGDEKTSGQANVSLGKWLTDRIFVAYTYRHGAAATENTSEGLLRYRFMPQWLVEVVFGDRGNGAADLLWTKRW